MPKVTEEYFENKRNMILDAAYKLCLEKTVSTVTMLDITKEAGLSKGGIYRFYKDIDLLFADLIDRMRKESDLKVRVDEILTQATEGRYQKTVYDIFHLLGVFMEEHLMGTEKIDFELNVLAMNAPERVERILKHTVVDGNKDYLAHRTTEFFMELEQEGKVKFKISGEEMKAFIESAYTGIRMNCIVRRCYYGISDKEDASGSPVKQMQVLAKAVASFMEISQER